MLNYFRQLTLPWLVAVSLMLVFTATWYHYEAKLQQQEQVQRFSAALQVSVVPYLTERNYQALNKYLAHTSAISRLPINAIALLSSTGTVLAASQAPSVSQKSIQQRYLASKSSNSFQLQKSDHLLVSVQQISGLQISPNTELASDNNAGQYYLLIMVENDLAFSVWLLPMVVVFIFGLIALAWIKNTLVQQQQRQQVDINLVAHKLRQLQQGQLNCRIDEQLMPGLESIMQSFNNMAEQYSEQQLGIQQQVTSQELALTHSTAALDQANSKVQSLEQHQAEQQRLLAYSAKNLQLVCQHKSGLASIELNQLVSNQITLLQLLALEMDFAPEQFILTKFVAEQLPPCQSWLQHKQIKLVLFEAAANALHKVDFNPFILAVLISALLQVSSRNAAVKQITLRIELLVNENSLNISVVSDGEGLSQRQRQLLETDDITALHWQDVDYAILAVLIKKFAITKQINSLEGLGCTTKLTIPLGAIEPLSMQYQSSILLFDTDTEHLYERKQELTLLATTVTYCTELAALECKAQQSHLDTLIIFLPAPAGLSLWQQTLAKLAQKSRILCYCSADSLDAWHQALGHLLQPNIFYLDTLLLASSQQAIKQLLVVDDNQTNLAFVRVLLKEQPIQLTLATTGQEALELCHQHNFDVILLDIQLPDINGVEVAKQLRALPAYQTVPILAFTAHALEQEKAEFIAAGMNDVILKPLQANKLQQILHWCSVNK